MSLWSKVKKFAAAFGAKPTETSAGMPEADALKLVQHHRQVYGEPMSDVVTGRSSGGKSLLAAKLQALQRLVVPDPPYRRSTTALRRFQRDANRQYLHVSVPITHEIQRLVTLFGERWFRRAHKGKGITYYRGQANG